MPDDATYTLFPIFKKVCYLTFRKPHFSKVHEKRINESTEHFVLPISQLTVIILCSVSGSGLFCDILGHTTIFCLHIHEFWTSGHLHWAQNAPVFCNFVKFGLFICESTKTTGCVLGRHFASYRSTFRGIPEQKYVNFVIFLFLH